MEIVAAFDFDGTLTKKDTFVPFLRFVAGTYRFCCALVLSIPHMIAFAFGLLSRQQLKERALTLCLKGMPLDKLQKHAESYTETFTLRDDVYQKLLWHQSEGHRCIIVSASLEYYLVPWAEKNGIEKVLATKLEITASGRITGKIAGNNCRGKEKVTRLATYLGSLDKVTLYAYGDSAGDSEMLAAADYAYK